MSAREKDLKELLEYYEQNLCHKIFKYELVKEIDEEEYRLSNQRFEEKYALFSQIVGLRN